MTTNAPAPRDAAIAERSAAATDRWHAARVRVLRAEEGWLSLVALAWLEPGANRVGRGADCSVRAAGFAADHVGTIHVDDSGGLRFVTAPRAVVAGLDAATGEQPIASDADGAATMLRNGTCTLFVIERAGRLAVRVRDAEAPLRRTMPDPERFAFDPAWCVEGTFVAAPAGSRQAVALVIGAEEEMAVAGRARFALGGRDHDVVLFDGSGPDRLFLVFGDATNGVETYGGGRFVEVLRRDDDRVVIDFNRASAPPCSFTPYATCPLPPASNRLPLRVEAGERSAVPHD